MRLAVFLLALLLGACAAANQNIVYRAPGFSGEKYRCIVVPPFENLSRTSSAGLAVADFVAHSLQTGPYKVVNRQEVQLLENNFTSLTEGLDPGRAVDLGKRLGADAVIIGTVSDYWYRSLDAKPEITVNMRIVDVSTSKVVFVTTGTHRPQFFSNAPLLLTAASKELSDVLTKTLTVGAAPRDLSRVACGGSKPSVRVAAAPPKPTKPEAQTVTNDVTGPEKDQPAEPVVVAAAPAAPLPAMTPGAFKLIRRMANIKSFVIEGISFELDKSTFQSEQYREELENIGIALQARSDLRIRFDVHTDGLGDPAFNRQVTEERANLLRAYLISNFNIEPNRVEAKGHGGTKPLLPNINRKNREANRRVELTVLQGP